MAGDDFQKAAQRVRVPEIKVSQWPEVVCADFDVCFLPQIIDKVRAGQKAGVPSCACGNDPTDQALMAANELRPRSFIVRFETKLH